MVQTFGSNVYPIQGSATNFLDFLGGKGNNPPPDLVFSPAPEDGNRYPIKILVMGIAPGVNSTIQELHARRFAEVQAWSPGIKGQNPNEIIRVTTRYFFIS